MSNRTIGDVAAIECDRLAIERVGEGFVGSSGIALRSCCERDAADEILVKLAIHSEPHTNASAVPVLNSSLRGIFPSDANVSGEAEASKKVLKTLELRLLFF